MEDYKKKYEEALERAKICYKDLNNLDGVVATMSKDFFEEIFPELKESKDEKMRNFISNELACLRATDEKGSDRYEELTNAITWLKKRGEKNHCNGEVNDEALQRQFQIWFDKGKCSGRDEVIFHPENFGLQKQGEQNPANKVEPKFKVGDWVVYNRNDSSREIIQVYDIRDGRYYFTDNVHFSWSIKECDEKAHLWTIQDAKDGDVLTWDDSKCIALFKEIYNKHSFKSHGCIGACTAVFENWGFHYIENAHPSTKEQRDLLFQKMKEVGYEWDAEKKELKKIEQNPSEDEDREYACQSPEHYTRRELMIYNLGIANGKRMIEDAIKETKQNPAWSEENEPQKELAETYLAVFDKKFPILPTLKGKKLADYKNFLNKCQQILGLKYWSIRPLQAKLFEKLSLLWAAWGAEHLKGLGQTNEEIGSTWHGNKISDTDIEYTSTDAFIDKATEWLKKNADNYTWYNEMEGESGMTDEFIEDFRKYMKGE